MIIKVNIGQAGQAIEQVKQMINASIVEFGKEVHVDTTNFIWDNIHEKVPERTGTLKKSMQKRIVFGYPVSASVISMPVSYAVPFEYGVRAGHHPPTKEGTAFYNWVAIKQAKGDLVIPDSSSKPTRKLAIWLARSIFKKGAKGKFLVRDTMAKLPEYLTVAVRSIAKNIFRF